MYLFKVLLSVLAIGLYFSTTAQERPPVQEKRSNVDWPAYGNDGGGNRYSPLTQVNSKNVKRLQPAWTCRTGELETYAGTNARSKAAFEATPVQAGNTRYFSTQSPRVFAIDATPGKQRWMY